MMEEAKQKDKKRAKQIITLESVKKVQSNYFSATKAHTAKAFAIRYRLFPAIIESSRSSFVSMRGEVRGSWTSRVSACLPPIFRIKLTGWRTADCICVTPCDPITTSNMCAITQKDYVRIVLSKKLFSSSTEPSLACVFS